MPLKAKRSFTGHHTLLPAVKPPSFTAEPGFTLLTYTFGRGSVIWRIWPAVLLHTVFAAIIVFLRIHEHLDELAIPSVMLTVLGVVIGFVISYRAMSGYDRYWMGRTAWSDVIRNARTMGRLIWFHVPPRLKAKSENEHPSTEELAKVMAEKRMALDLVEGFAVSLKHHLRGEVGIYFEDLYDLVRPLHAHTHTKQARVTTTALASPPPNRLAHRIASNPGTPAPSNSTDSDPIIPPINTYGTFLRRRSSSASSRSHDLAPSQTPSRDIRTVFGRVSGNLIPFAGMFNSAGKLLRRRPGAGGETGTGKYIGHGVKHAGVGGGKHRLQPKENLPLEILRCLSEWCSVLEERGSVPGTSLGSLIGSIAAMEDSLSTLEKILTTPLPFVYAVHIRHTVWLYLFFLPFQLVNEFGWYTIPGVSIASFIYLGFLAAGEEIEQPFGYDDNDLELDMYIRDIIHIDVENLKRTRCLNAWFPPQAQQPVIEGPSNQVQEGAKPPRNTEQSAALVDVEEV
ncbi:UPF0187-domain-containing protein [Moniliophthora roreri MCA 2997]|uniref:UPF0187-domain-containing protein n=1 Tax=Moniliophthora roreri (strain MCA 2997) TaxID=1381753 RepID=V2WYR0_MONRO|nr:UPF0187-domain-containing protein [Moniliophthora roreri MCA 2997]